MGKRTSDARGIRAGMGVVVLLLIAAPGRLAGEAPPPPAHRTADTLLTRLVSENLHPFRYEDGRATGPAVDLLERAGRAAHFFMVGEQHAVQQVPFLVGELHRRLAPVGYGPMAVETSPLVSDRLEEAFRRGGGDALVRWATAPDRRGRIPFYSWEEEARLLAGVLERTHPRTGPDRRPLPVLWGVDQEYVFGAAATLRELAERAPTPALRARIERHAAAADSTEPAMIRGEGRAWLLTVDAEELDALAAAFPPADTASANRLRELRESARIYRLFVEGRNWESNDLRERAMKEDFIRRWRAWAAAGPPPRVFLKLGALHLYRGRRPRTHAYSLANFVQELAVAEGLEAFNLLVLVGPGSWQGDATVATGFSTNGLDGLPAVTDPDGPVMLDLRPLRSPLAAGRLEAPPAFVELVWKYDAVAVIPGATRATGLLPAGAGSG